MKSEENPCARKFLFRKNDDNVFTADTHNVTLKLMQLKTALQLLLYVVVLFFKKGVPSPFYQVAVCGAVRCYCLCYDP